MNLLFVENNGANFSLDRNYRFVLWRICHQRVYRTRKEAIAACIGTGKDGNTWNDVKDHFRVVKVKCVVL